MPELPEVETMRRGISRIVGSRVAGVERVRCRRRPIAIEPAIGGFRRRAVGATIAGIERIGKRVVVRLDRPEAIVFEPRMTGLVLLTEPPTAEHLRVRIGLDGGPACELLYWDRRGLGSVRLLSSAELARRYDESTVGPDALAITAGQLCERLGGSRRAIKVALLDQRAVAGIGNLYAAEILHRAGIHPERRCDRLRASIGGGSKRPPPRFWRWRSATRGRRSPTARIAMRSIRPAAIRTIIGFMIGPANSARSVAAAESGGPCKLSGRPSSARAVNRGARDSPPTDVAMLLCGGGIAPKCGATACQPPRLSMPP